jgi:hypothetical protein
MSTLRIRNRKRKNKQSQLKLRKRDPSHASNTVEVDKTNPTLFQDTFEALNRNISVVSNIRFNKTDTQFSNSLTIENTESNQDNQSNHETIESDQRDQDYKSDQDYQSDFESDQDYQSDRTNINDFIFEKPSNLLPDNVESEFGPYFANFTEMAFFIWVTKHSICMNIL